MILVTGGTGMLGAYLLLYLSEKEKEIRAIYRMESSIEETKKLFANKNKLHLWDSINWMQADITKTTTLAKVFDGITEVYHCAALISFAAQDEAILRKTNIEGTANIVNFCIDFNVKKILYVSSIAALGDLLPNEKLLSETSEWNPEKYHSDYAISKYGAEMEVWRGQQEGLQVIIVNPGIILGRDFKKNASSKMLETLSKKSLFYTPGKAGFILVQDVVKIMVYLMANNYVNERFCLVAETLSFKEIAFSLAKIKNKKPPKYQLNIGTLTFIMYLEFLFCAVFGSKRKLSKAIVEAAFNNTEYSNQKIKAIYKEAFTPVVRNLKG